MNSTKQPENNFAFDEEYKIHCKLIDRQIYPSSLELHKCLLGPSATFLSYVRISYDCSNTTGRKIPGTKVINRVRIPKSGRIWVHKRVRRLKYSLKMYRTYNPSHCSRDAILTIKSLLRE